MRYLQYGIPAVSAGAYFRARGRHPDGYLRAAERVAFGEAVDGPSLVAAGRLASVVWSMFAFGSVLALIVTIVVVRWLLTPGAWPSRAVVNVFPGILAVALGMMVVVRVRLRAAERSVARGDRVPSASAMPKGHDLVLALGLSLALEAFANVVPAGLSH